MKTTSYAHVSKLYTLCILKDEHKEKKENPMEMLKTYCTKSFSIYFDS